MSLSTLIRKGGLRELATLATQRPTVAKVARVAVANPMGLAPPVAAGDPADARHAAFEERAAILEYDGGFDREEAERLAHRMVYTLPIMRRVICADSQPFTPDTIGPRGIGDCALGAVDEATHPGGAAWLLAWPTAEDHCRAWKARRLQ